MASKLLEKSYFIFLIVLPLVFFPNTIDPALIPRQFVLSIFILALLSIVAFQKIAIFGLPFKNPIYISFLVFLICCAAPFLGVAHSTSESWYFLSKLLVIFAFFLLTTLFLYSKSIDAKAILQSAQLFGGIAIGSALVQIIKKSLAGQHLFHQVNVIDGLFANKNLLSAILFLCLPFFFLGTQETKKWKYFSWIGIFGALFIILVIRTRAVLLASVVFILLLLYFYLRIQLRVSSIKLIAFSASTFAAIAIFYRYYISTFILGLKSSNNPTEQYLYRIFDSKTLNYRTQFWENSLQMFQEHPLLGVGLGNWQVYFPKYGLGKFTNFEIANGIHTLQRPHNDFLQILCENGVLGFIGYYFLFGLVFYFLFSLFKNSKSTTEQWKYAFIFSGIVGFMLISFFDFPMERIEHQVLLVLLFSIVVSEYYSKNKDLKDANYNNRFVLLFIAIAALFSLTVSYYRFKGEVATAKLYFSKRHEEWDKTVQLATNASSSFYQIDPTSIPLEWYKGLAYFNQKNISESTYCFEKAYENAPYQIQVLNNLGSCYQVTGNFEKAKSTYLTALQISPQFEEARLNLAALYFNAKEYENAFRTIDLIAINSKNPKYTVYLVPILTHQLNAILAKNGNENLSKKIAAEVTNSQKIMQLYFSAKKRKIDFKSYIINPDLIIN